MFSNRLGALKFAEAHKLRAFAGSATVMILLTAVYSGILGPAALAQTSAYAQIAMQEAKSKVRPQIPKPVESEALYVCTLSGFGNLAHCYLRKDF